MTLEVGRRIGKFVLESLLGRGGMGEVWKAQDSELNRPVALKILKGTDEEEVARFVKEAQTAGRLNHPNIAVVHEAGQVEGRHFIAMQLVDGRTLRAMRGAKRREAVEWVRDAARAVAFAHAQGIVHRDLKPENVMVTAEGRVYVLDFGLARHVESKASLSGSVVGTPAYMPPEQARGERADARSDVFGLGATLYELLAGRAPFEGRTVYEVLQKVQEAEPASPGVERDLETILFKCLEKDPARRYGGAAEVADDLTRWLEGAPIAARAPSPGYLAAKFIARRKAVVVVSAIAVAVAAFLTWRLAVDRGERAAEEAATLLFEDGRRHLERAVRGLYDAKAEPQAVVRAAEDARQRIEAGLAKAPLMAVGHYLLGRARDLMGERERAEEAWRAAIALDPSFAPARFELGRSLGIRSMLVTAAVMPEERTEKRSAATELAQEATRQIEAALSAGVLDGDLQRDLASTLLAFAQGDGATALERARIGAVRHKDRDGVEDFYWLIGVATPGRLSIQAYSRAIDRRPKHALAWFGRAIAKSDAGDFAGALTDSLEGLRLDTRNHFARYNAGLARWRTGDPAGAIREFDEVLAAHPEFWSARLNRGAVRQGAGDFAGALVEFDEVIRREPARWPAYLSRAQVRLALGDVKGALADADEGVRQARGRASPYMVRAEAREAGHDREGALEDLGRAIELEPDRAGLRLRRSDLRMMKGDEAGALEDLNEAIRRNNDDARALRARGLLKTATRDFTGAIADLSRAIEVIPGWAEAWSGRSAALARAGELNEAIQDATEAIRLAPGLVEAWVNRGNARGAAKDRKGAIADFERALELAGPEQEALRQRILEGLRRLKE